MDAIQRREFFIGAIPASGTASIADGVVFDANSLANGEIVVVNTATGKVETDLSTAGKYIIYQKTLKGELIGSDPIDTTKIDQNVSTKYQAATQKVECIGYNGTTGSLPYGDNETFNVNIKFKPRGKFDFGANKICAGGYDTASSATEQEVATYLTRDLGENALRYDIKVEMISSDDGTANSAGVGTITVTKGSKYVTVATATTNLIATSAIRFGTGVTDPIYIIEAADATNKVITLHAPYQGESGTFVPNTGTEYITAAELTAASFGIKITGLDDTDFKRDYREYMFTDWNTELTGTGFDGEASSLTIVTTPVYPVNSGMQVADLETRTRQYFSEGKMYDDWGYTKADQKTDAILGTGYDTNDIETKDDSYTGIGATSVSRFGITIAVPSLKSTVTLPATVASGGAYFITIDGTQYNTVPAAATTAALLTAITSVLGAAGIDFVVSGTDTVYVAGETVTVSTGLTDDMTVAANTAIKYSGWGTWFS